MSRRFGFVACIVAGLLVPLSALAQLQKGDYVAVIGDSITEQKKYSLYIEEYLVMCQPAAELRQTQFGWSGETSWGFEGRMGNDMLRFKPTVATTCFGMNDGSYAPLSDERARQYRSAQTKIVRKMKAAGVRFIVVGSPGCVDVATYRNHDHAQAEMYNKTLSSLRDIAKDVAEKESVVFADVYTPMHQAMEAAEAKYGPAYNVCGADGVHPDNNGHLIMTYAFLKGLGCDGNIGTITVDLAANTAQATDGHKVLSVSNGAVELESTRYPFRFFNGDLKSPASTEGILEFVPFNQELNRLMLIVNNAGSGKVKITWGKGTKEFDAAQLAKGINLAAEFMNTPFLDAFLRVERQIQNKQEWETPLVKGIVNQILQVPAAARGPLNEAANKAVDVDKDLSQALTLSVEPVKHTIKIEVVK